MKKMYFKLILVLLCLSQSILYLFTAEVFSCLKIETDGLKNEIVGLYQELNALDKELEQNNSQLQQVEFLIAVIAEDWSKLLADKIELEKSGAVLERSIAVFVNHLTFLRQKGEDIPGIADLIEEFVGKINEATFKLNVFRREIDKIIGKMAYYERKSSELQKKSLYLSGVQDRLLITISVKEKLLAAKNFELKYGLSEMARLEDRIILHQLRVSSYRSRISFLNQQIAALSSQQEGTVVPAGLNDLFGQLSLARSLLAESLRTLELLEAQHGC